MNAIYVMDTIQGLGGKLVWITPKVREEYERRELRRRLGANEAAKFQ
jgi:hypothetical protein